MASNDYNEDEDDYMSNSFIDKITDVRPGLVSGNLAKIYKNEMKTKLHNELNKQKNKPLNVMQQEKREEGLQNAIPATNIGFKLLEKMGYKQNTGIGKSENGIKEPVTLTIKSDRKGLGHIDLKRKNKRNTDEEDRLKKFKYENQWRESVKGKQNEREVSRDLKKSQAACEQLDSALAITMPEFTFYWPVDFLPRIKNKNDEDDYDDEDDLDDDYRTENKQYTEYAPDGDDDYDCGDDDGEEEEEEEDEFPFNASEKLQKLTDYLRSKHFYCVWCGVKYNDGEDLESNCPGGRSNLHD